MAASEESYEEMINILQKYVADAGECCDSLSSAAQDCVDNTDNDPAAVTASGNVNECVANVSGQLEAISQIASALQEELEEIRAAAARVQAMG